MRRSRLIPLIIACALFMENVDSTVLSTSLPAIAVDLKVDPIALKLALTSYLLSLAVFIPISGWVADKYGARTVFRTAIAIFTASSIACGLSSTLPEFVLFRALQGLGGAMMVPVGRLIILRSVPKRELVSALAWLTVPALVGPVMGPPLGGFITTFLDWRLIFFINVPAGILGILLATRFIENVKEADPPPLDAGGALLSAVGLAGFVLGIASFGQALLPAPAAGAITAVGLAAIALYVLHARRHAHPILDLDLLRIPTFRGAVIAGSLFRIGVGAMPFLLPLMLQLGFGLTPFASGLLTFASAAGALVMKTTAAPILRQFGFKPVLVINAAISASFLAATAFFTPQTPHAAIILVLLTGGFFRSLEFTSINAMAYAEIEQDRMSSATSFAGAMQQVSVSLGVAVGALALEIFRTSRHETHVTLADFSSAFLMVAAITASSMLLFLRLPADAGAELNGRKEPRAEPA